VLARIAVKEALDGRLVPAVRQLLDAVSGPGLVHPRLVPCTGGGNAGVRADRGHVDQVRHPGGVGGGQHRAAPADAHPFEVGDVVRRLEQPREVNHGVGPDEQRGEPRARVWLADVDAVPAD
jgi:hypothetical protein